jgi:hypothetical protein
VNELSRSRRRHRTSALTAALNCQPLLYSTRQLIWRSISINVYCSVPTLLWAPSIEGFDGRAAGASLLVAYVKRILRGGRRVLASFERPVAVPCRCRVIAVRRMLFVGLLLATRCRSDRTTHPALRISEPVTPQFVLSRSCRPRLEASAGCAVSAHFAARR